MTDDARRGGALSDGEILTRLDTITGDIAGIRTDMATWRDDVVAKDVYKANRETWDREYAYLKETDERIADEVVDLKAEATRRARERRQLWTGIVVALIGAIAASVISWDHGSRPVCTHPQLVNSHVVCDLP